MESQSLDLDIIFDNGFVFLKLIECLKNSEISILEFSRTLIRYNELVNKQTDPKKKYLSINNSFEIYPSKLNKYYYGFNEAKYLMFFDVKELKDKIKDCKKGDKIRIYKNKDEDLIYTITIKPDGSPMGMSFFKPFNMQNQEFIVYAKSLREEDNPNCTVKPKILKENCSKVKPSYKKVTLVCYHSHMIVKIIGPDNSNGHVFPYGTIPVNLPVNIDVNKLNINLNTIKLPNNINIMNTANTNLPVKVNINKNTSFEINISTQAFKSLGKLVPLSDEPIKIFFEEGYIKILTSIGDFGHIRTYIGNDFNI